MEQVKIFNATSKDELEKDVNAFLAELTQLEPPEGEPFIKESTLNTLHIPIADPNSLDMKKPKFTTMSIYTLLIRYNAPVHMGGVEIKE